MANTLDLRRRIRSVKSTEQITKAMKMVAAAKLRRAQTRVEEARPYGNALEEVLRSVAARVSSKRYPLLEERPEKRVTLVVVVGNKGLAGAFNANVLREAQRLMASDRWPDVELFLVGRKAADYFRHKGKAPVATDIDIMNNVTTEKAYALARTLEARFTAGETDAIYLLSNRFRSIIQQKVTLVKLLPVPRSEVEVQPQDDEVVTPYLYEPSAGALLAQLLPRYVETQVLRAVLSSQAAEHAARMTAMDAASKNAGEMIDSLTLQYNRLRQASITKELIEIVSGAQALES